MLSNGRRSDKTRGEKGSKDEQGEKVDEAVFTEKTDAAEYIASLLEGLRHVADGAELSFLAYLIGVALEEARSEQARGDTA
ncbi:hypothetical protein V6C03_12310 [Methyloligella sp. 2.7D]|uniref:hypothetical protein n=1 Tax=unclassified Methyloligella TaxID=2625955 RepID=UPI00157C83DA|nr:hypothetical protein [Methyloligella sp. GL2]QKP77425.1 hypothetical protein HT051_08150 [Methyloligella sp. GL2]